MNALLRKFECNLWDWADPSHGFNCDLDGSMVLVHIKQLLLLYLIKWNLPHGWDKDESRLCQLRESCKRLHSMENPRRIALWMEAVDDIIAENERAGKPYPGKKDIDLEAWDRFCSRGEFVKYERRVSFGRFAGVLKAIKAHLPNDAADKLDGDFLALEEDMLSNKALRTRMTMRARDGDADMVSEGGAPLSVQRLQLEDRTLKSACANAVSIGVMTQAVKEHKHILEIVFEFGSDGLQWYEHFNQFCRSVTNCKTWFEDQLKGSVINVVKKMIDRLASGASLKRCGFTIDNLGKIPPNDREPVMLLEDELADIAGGFCFGLGTKMLCRHVEYLTWPRKALEILVPELREQCLADAKAACLDFEWLQGLDKDTKTQAIYDRHLFHMIPCRHAMASFKEFDFKYHDDQKKMLELRALVCNGTQLEEDKIGSAKALTRGQCGPKYRRPELAVAAVLKAEVLTERHDYQTMTDVVSCNQRLAADVFEATKQTRSVNLQEIQSEKESTDWWSPSPANAPIPAADLPLIRVARLEDSVERFSQAFLGSAVSVKHRIAFKETRDGVTLWYIGLHSFRDSSVLVWPAIMHNYPVGGQYLAPRMDVDSSYPMLKVITNLDDDSGSEACVCKWASWARQAIDYKALTNLQPGLRFTRASEIMTWKRLLASYAYFTMPLYEIKKFAAHFGIPLRSGVTLFSALFEVVKTSLALDDDDLVLDIIHKRLSASDIALKYSDEFLNCDLAIEVLDRFDKDKIEAEKKTLKTESDERYDFSKEFVAQRKDVRDRKAAAAAVVAAAALAAAPKAKAKAKGKAGLKGAGKGKDAPPPPPAPLVFTFHCDLAEGKLLLPPNTFLWRGLSRGAWWAHMQVPVGLPRMSEAFIKHGGSNEALRVLLQRLWKCHLEFSGRPLSDCPITRLFI